MVKSGEGLWRCFLAGVEKQRCSRHPSLPDLGQGNQLGSMVGAFPGLWSLSCRRVCHTMVGKGCFANTAVLLSLLLLICPEPVEAFGMGLAGIW